MVLAFERLKELEEKYGKYFLISGTPLKVVVAYHNNPDGRLRGQGGNAVKILVNIERKIEDAKQKGGVLYKPEPIDEK